MQRRTSSWAVWLVIAFSGSLLPVATLAQNPFELPEPVETAPANDAQPEVAAPATISELSEQQPEIQQPETPQPETRSSEESLPEGLVTETSPATSDIPSIAADEHAASDTPCDCDCPECFPASPCYGQLCPCRYSWAEALILDRDTDSGLRRSDLFDFDVAGGLRIGYGYRTGNCTAYEFGYLGVFDQSASTDFGNYDVRYSSDLNSFEANLVRCSSSSHCAGRSTEWLGGFRYLNLEEDLVLSSVNYGLEVENNLYGVQAGARLRRCRGCWSWEATGKAGIFANDMERTGFRGDETDVAFVGDLNFTAIYRLSGVWGLRAGYNLIWLEGVALAPDQLEVGNSFGTRRHVADNGGVFLDGVNVGLEARW